MYIASILSKLTDDQYKNFMQTHQKHLSAMGKSAQEKHQLENINKITVHSDCFHVHYDNGDWYHYTFSHNWY